jgi:hypothetical protein
MSTQNDPQLDVADQTSEDAPEAKVTKTKSKTKEKVAPKKKKEKCYRLFIHEKQNDQDLDYVPVGVNGEVLQITRGTEVVIPERFKEVLEHAKYPVYRVKPGQTRKVTSWVRKVPFDVLGEATYEEYEKMRKSGTAKHREELEKAEKEADK